MLQACACASYAGTASPAIAHQGLCIDRHAVCRRTPFRSIFTSHGGSRVTQRCPKNSTACTSPTLSQALNAAATERPVKLGDGCRYVFIDAGSNRGSHLHFLFEPEVFPDSWYNTLWQHFASQFGHGFANDPSVCAYAFEPNKAHAVRLQRLALAWRSRGKRIEVFHVALSNQSALTTMYHQQTDINSSEWGFGAFAGPSSISKVAEPVATVSIASFARYELLGRVVPPPLLSSSPPPTVVVKLDVEGLELDVLRDLWLHGFLCDGTIGLISVEFHPRLWPPDILKDNAWLLEFVYRHADVNESSGHLHALRHRAWTDFFGRRVIKSGRLEESINELAAQNVSLALARRCLTPTRFADRDDETYALMPDTERRPWE